ncbi:MAG: septum formation initiator family protein [Ignavibacteriaceae bacterium]
MNFLNKKLNIYIISVIFLIGILFLFFNDFGVLKYMKLQNEVNDLNQQIEEIQAENTRLQKEIDSLKQNIPAKIEEVAREKYDMIREGEKAIKIE